MHSYTPERARTSANTIPPAIPPIAPLEIEADNLPGGASMAEVSAGPVLLVIDDEGIRGWEIESPLLVPLAIILAITYMGQTHGQNVTAYVDFKSMQPEYKSFPAQCIMKCRLL